MRVLIAAVYVCVLFWALEGALTRKGVQKALEEKREEQLEDLLEHLIEVQRLDDYTEQKKALVLEPIDKSLNAIEPVPCCSPGSTTVDLRNGGVFVSDGGVVEVLKKPEGVSNGECSLRALLKVSFTKLPECISGCVSYPLCGRRMLRVDLDLSPNSRSGFLFNIGDSVSNDGFSGDGNTQTNDAEVEAVYPSVHVRASDNCPDVPNKLLDTYTDAVRLGSVNRTTLFISNEHVRITNNNGLNQILCHKCLFALNGQTDLGSGGVNEDIYIALNRVITGRSDRNGVGVCSAKLSWVCPKNY
ncbi:hypothetical protein DPMN_001963 [Dreissena polymorpha]|uniref:Uncharacterized protein n=1 Tax=Dreissena polymorpha TaxID=45954 RepID=A0A9D4MM91_DREPO|nr:hypothetical protein DPMN_001963 [Dreissena polymorpha]